MKQGKRLASLFMVVALIVATTISAYAASGTVTYRYSNTHIIPMMDSDLGISTVTSIGVDVDLSAEFNYSSSDTQSRTYNNEEYSMLAKSINAPSLTSQLSFNMGTLEVYPAQGTVKRCNKSYTPEYYLTPDYLYFNAVGSNTTLAILKSGNSYGQLGYMIVGGSMGPQSGTATFNNLGGATGTVIVNDFGGVELNSSYTKDDFTDTVNANDVAIFAEAFEKRLAESEQYELNLSSNIRYQALLSYAKDKNFLVSDQEVNAYIDKLLNDYRHAVNRETIEKACIQAGTTYEEIVRSDFNGYKILLTEEKVYEDFLADYLKENNLTKDKISETVQNQIFLEWDAFMGNLVENLNSEVL